MKDNLNVRRRNRSLFLAILLASTTLSCNDNKEEPKPDTISKYNDIEDEPSGGWANCAGTCYYCPPRGNCPAGDGWYPPILTPPAADGSYTFNGTTTAIVQPDEISCNVHYMLRSQVNGAYVTRVVSVGASSPKTYANDGYRFVYDSWARDATRDSPSGNVVGFIVYYHFVYREMNSDDGIYGYYSGSTMSIRGTYSFENNQIIFF